MRSITNRMTPAGRRRGFCGSVARECARCRRRLRTTPPGPQADVFAGRQRLEGTADDAGDAGKACAQREHQHEDELDAHAGCGQDIAIGDWVQYDIHDGRQFTINRIHCRILKDVNIIAKLKDPKLVY